MKVRLFYYICIMSIKISHIFSRKNKLYRHNKSYELGILLDSRRVLKECKSDSIITINLYRLKLSLIIFSITFEYKND